MAHKSHLQFTPPITRVHNIFRIRTVVNAVTTKNEKSKLPNDKEIGIVLAKTGLSKYRREKVKDRIMRRARDHLLTASYMGLLTRSGRPFGYSSTTIGKLLKEYSTEEECPPEIPLDSCGRGIPEPLFTALRNAIELNEEWFYSFEKELREFLENTKESSLRDGNYDDVGSAAFDLGIREMVKKILGENKPAHPKLSLSKTNPINTNRVNVKDEKEGSLENETD